MNRIFVKVNMAWTMAIDIVPCLDGIERQFCRRNANDWAIFVVEQFVVKSDAAAKQRSDAG